MHSRQVRLLAVAFSFLLYITLVPTNAGASVIAVGVGAFGAGSTLTTFAGVPDGTEVNGLIVDGITFTYSLGNGNLVIDGGPGVTNNVAPPNVVSIGNPAGVLTMKLSSFANTFGYGYALLNTITVPNATTISLFSGATPVGALSYTGTPDPTFTGGFAGIQSTIPFDSVAVTFAAAPSFALDNVRTFNAVSTVPEPPIAVLLLAGIGSLWICRRIRKPVNA